MTPTKNGPMASVSRSTFDEKTFCPPDEKKNKRKVRRSQYVKISREKRSLGKKRKRDGGKMFIEVNRRRDYLGKLRLKCVRGETRKLLKISSESPIPSEERDRPGIEIYLRGKRPKTGQKVKKCGSKTKGGSRDLTE